MQDKYITSLDLTYMSTLNAVRASTKHDILVIILGNFTDLIAMTTSELRDTIAEEAKDEYIALIKRSQVKNAKAKK